MKIQVRLFALARQLAGAEVVEVELPEGGTVGDLRRQLAISAPALEPVLKHCTFAVNSNYASDATAVGPQDEIGCIPPVSGG